MGTTWCVCVSYVEDPCMVIGHPGLLSLSTVHSAVCSQAPTPGSATTTAAAAAVCKLRCRNAEISSCPEPSSYGCKKFGVEWVE